MWQSLSLPRAVCTRYLDYPDRDLVSHPKLGCEPLKTFGVFEASLQAWGFPCLVSDVIAPNRELKQLVVMFKPGGQCNLWTASPIQVGAQIPELSDACGADFLSVHFDFKGDHG
jgi:hypothetical protein